MNGSTRKNVLAVAGGFAVALVFLLFVASPLQARYGMTGLVLTELGLLALALLGTALFRAPWRQVFCLHRPALRGVFGALLLWLGAYILVLLAAIATMLAVPQRMTDVSTAMTDLFVQVPFGVRFLIVAVMPALCEEMLFRGFLLFHMRPMPAWARVAVCGILFGAFHLDPVRFLPTAILGVAITWAVLYSGNLLYAVLIHLFNNGLSTLSTLAADAAGTEAAAAASTELMTPAVLGVYFFLAALSPWLCWAGSSLLRPKGRPAPDRARTALVCLVCSAACIVIGWLLLRMG